VHPGNFPGEVVANDAPHFPFSTTGHKLYCTPTHFTGIMEPSLTAVLLVDHKFRTLTRRFLVETTSHDSIHHLKEKVKEERPNELSRFQLSDVSVWKTKGETVTHEFNCEPLAEMFERINVHDKDSVEELSEDRKVADLGLSNGETLLVRLPGTTYISAIVGCALMQIIAEVGDLVAKELDPEYELCFPRAFAKVFTDWDLQFNNIYDAPEGDMNIPNFVKHHEELLNQKRTLDPNVRCFRIFCFSTFDN
jgi:hypothetical protein